MKPRLKFAFDHYDRHIPLLDGSVSVEGFDIEPLIVGQVNDRRDGRNRHERMLRDGEFDVAEVSLSSYLVAKDRGLPFTAVPAFPRRLFSQSQIWINAASGIREPADLAGKRIALNSFQTTLCVLAKGDLQADYGVPWRGIEWWVEYEDTVPTDLGGVRIRRIPESVEVGALLQRGEIDAIFRSRLPRQALDGAAEIRRLFPDPKAEEQRQFKRKGFFPIMHVIVFCDEVLREHPAAGPAFVDLYARLASAASRFYDDPNWSWLAWSRHHVEEQQARLGNDMWPAGVAKNRANLGAFIGYSHDQGLIRRRLAVDELFSTNTLGT